MGIAFAMYCNVCKCVDEDELKGTLWLVFEDISAGNKTTYAGEGTDRAKVASAIVQISDGARAEHHPISHLLPTYQMPCRLLSPFNEQSLAASHDCATRVAAPKLLLSPGLAVRQASGVTSTSLNSRLKCSNTTNDGGAHCSDLQRELHIIVLDRTYRKAGCWS